MPVRIAGTIMPIPRPDQGPPRHRLFAIEYFNPGQHGRHEGRFFKKPDAEGPGAGRKGQTPLAGHDAGVRA